MRFDGLVLFLARGGGAGLVARAPGTVGSLLGIPLALGIRATGWPPALQAGLLALCVVAACLVAQRACTLLDQHDSAEIVIDEVVGMAVALLGHDLSLETIAVVFVFFRFFDIIKIWPANLIDRRVTGGIGVVFDDLVSGVYASVLAWGIGF